MNPNQLISKLGDWIFGCLRMEFATFPQACRSLVHRSWTAPQGSEQPQVFQERGKIASRPYDMQINLHRDYQTPVNCGESLLGMIAFWSDFQMPCRLNLIQLIENKSQVVEVHRKARTHLPLASPIAIQVAFKPWSDSSECNFQQRKIGFWLVEVAPMVKSFQIRLKLMHTDLSCPGKHSDGHKGSILIRIQKWLYKEKYCQAWARLRSRTHFPKCYFL